MGKRRKRGKDKAQAAEPEPSPPPVPEWRFPAITIGLIVIVGLAIYGQSHRFDFVNFDDPMLVLNNADIRELNLPSILTPEAGQSYQPLRVLSYAIDYRIAGYSPRVYHLHNLLLHVVAGVLLFFFLRAFLADLRTPQAEWIAAAVALLFVVHPANVESVAWVASRKYGLLAIFAFASLLLAFRSLQSSEQRKPLLGWAVGAWVAALLSSPVAIVLPILVLLMAWTREEAMNPKELLRGTWARPWLIGLALSLPLQIWVLTGGGGVSVKPVIGSPFDWLVAMPRVFVDYLRNLSLPFWLNARYPDEVVMSWKLGLGVVALGALAWWLHREWQAGRKLSIFGTAWFFVCMGPVANIVPISTLMADRYLYLAAIGPFLLLVLQLNRLPAKQAIAVAAVCLLALTIGAHQRTRVWSDSETLWRDSVAKAPNNGLACVNLGAALQEKGELFEAAHWFEQCLEAGGEHAGAAANLGTLRMQTGDLSGGIEAFEAALALNPNLDRACLNLGAAFQQQGRLYEAERWLVRGVQLNPKLGEAHTNLGNIYVRMEHFDEAFKAYQRALLVDANDHATFYNAGLAHEKQDNHETALAAFKRAHELAPNHPAYATKYGAALTRAGQLELAESALLGAQKIDANLAPVQRHLGALYAAKRNWQQSMYHYERALSLAPTLADAKAELADIASQLGEVAPPLARRYGVAAADIKMGDQHRAQKLIDLATERYSAALTQDPAAVDAHFGLGVMALEGGKVREAFSHFTRVIQLTQDHYPTHSVLGSMYYAMKDFAKAQPHFEALIRLNPTSDEGYNNLGAYYFGEEDYERAIPLLERAIALKPDYFMALRNLGACYAATGRAREALVYYMKAAEINPDDPQTKEFLYLHGVKGSE